MGSTPLGGCKGYFLKFLFSNIRSHITNSKWGRKYVFMNYKCCNGSPQKIPFQFANGKLPHFGYRAFLLICYVNHYAWKSKWSKLLIELRARSKARRHLYIQARSEKGELYADCN